MTRADPLRPATMGAPATNTQLGRYRLLRMIGEGGMGTVFEAVHEDIGRRVAVKVLRDGPGEGTVARERFFREARAAARVRHPGVVQVHDVDVDGATAYLVMDLLEGETLAQRLERGPIAPGDLASLLGSAIEGLAAAHAAGVVHRDLKPGNIFLARAPEGERATVVDFGISRLVDECSDLTGSIAVLGTAPFMSPEQCRGERDLTPASDQFSLGAVLYECLSGRRPFDGPNPLNVTWKILSGQRTPLAEAAPGLPPLLVAAVERALSTDPAARFPSMGDFGAALREGHAVAVPPRRRRVPVLGALGAMAALALLPLAVVGPRHLAPVAPLSVPAVVSAPTSTPEPVAPVVRVAPLVHVAPAPIAAPAVVRRPPRLRAPAPPRTLASVVPVASAPPPPEVAPAPAVGRNRALILGR